MGDSKQRLVRFMFPKGHSGYREQDGSRGEGAKRESSEEPLDCGSEGGSVLRDAPRPSPPHWLARGSQQLERSRQVTTLFSWERCRARPGWLGRWGLWEARTTRQRRGGTPPPRAGLPGEGASKGLWHHSPRVGQEGGPGRKMRFASIWQGSPGRGINYSQLPRVGYLGSSPLTWERAPDQRSRKGPPSAHPAARPPANFPFTLNSLL